MGHFVNGLSDIALSINLILVKFSRRVVHLLGVCGNGIVVEVALNRNVIAPVFSSIGVFIQFDFIEILPGMTRLFVVRYFNIFVVLALKLRCLVICGPGGLMFLCRL